MKQPTEHSLVTVQIMKWRRLNIVKISYIFRTLAIIAANCIEEIDDISYT